MTTKSYFHPLTSAVLVSSLLVMLTLAALAHGKNGATAGEAHRSAVSKVVEELKEVAGKDRNIGEEVRQVAQEEETSSQRATEAIEAVETRGRFRTFLFGTDYRNIGALRSELVTTQNHIDRLTKAKERTGDQAVKAELDAQIAELMEAKTSAESFIREHEGQFSLLGWLVRLFR